MNDPAEPEDEAKADDTSALDWENPIYDNSQWEPPPPSGRGALFEMLLRAIVGGGAALYAEAERRHAIAERRKPVRTQNPPDPLLLIFDPFRHFYRWPMAGKLAAVIGVLVAVGLTIWIEVTLRAMVVGHKVEPSQAEFYLAILAVYGLAILIAWSWQSLRRRPDEPKPPTNLNVDVQIAPDYTAPDIVSSPSGNGAGQVVALVLVLVALGALIGALLFFRR